MNMNIFFADGTITSYVFEHCVVHIAKIKMYVYSNCDLHMFWYKTNE